jgi:hypothetical protein
VTPEQRALAQAYEAVGCAMAALERAYESLNRVKDAKQGNLTKARQYAAVAQTDIGVEIMRRIG